MDTLSNNAELYQYLLRLAAILEARNAKQLGEAVVHASKCSAGMSTEFLGESRIALRQVLKKGAGALTAQEHDDVKEVLRQLDQALDDRLSRHDLSSANRFLGFTKPRNKRGSE
jgi:hypothetical protein